MKLFLLPLLLCLSVGAAACNSSPQAGPQADDSAGEARVFEYGGFRVQGDFLRFFEHYGGVESLGHPISGEMTAGGWRVQYFENGRLEYHPENEPAYRVTVGWLGELLHRRRPPIPPGSIPPVTARNVRYFAETGHTLSGDFLNYFEANGGSVRFGLPISEPFLWAGQLAQDFQSARFLWAPAETPPVRLEAIGRAHFNTIDAKK